jgi:ribose transport system permease protein
MKRYLNLVALLFAWLVIFGIFSILVPASFPTLANIETLMRQVVIVGFGAIGMTYIIMSGGIDLSAGSVVALVTVVIALALKKGYNPGVALAAGLCAGVACGWVNGILISRLRVGAFIVTLAGLLAFRGAAKGLGNEQKVDAPLTWLSDFTSALSSTERWKLLPSGAWLMIVCALLASAALKYTVFGRHVVAIGSNEQAARLSGVRVSRVKTGVYVLGGLFFGIAGLMQFSRLTVGDPTVAVGLELDIIAAVVIGGGSLSGGEGSIFGSLIGALIMTTIRAGGSQMGMPNWIQEIVTGCIILIAVAVDRWRAARAAAKAL